MNFAANFDTTHAVLAIARERLGNDSARVCYADAVSCFDRGDYEHATQRALASLRHSVGVFHEDYKRAAA